MSDAAEKPEEEGPLTKWRVVTVDDYVRLKTSIPGLKQVTIRSGWALMRGDEVVAFWKYDTHHLKNTVMVRIE